LTTNLAGKVAVVTGAAQGIGEIYAGYLAGLGATVILADLAGDAVKDNAARLEK
jgi:3-hydroxybutyrate dehydrogenase